MYEIGLLAAWAVTKQARKQVLGGVETTRRVRLVAFFFTGFFLLPWIG